MVGTSVALGFPLGVVGGFLEGLQRFEILNWTNVVSTLLRALLIVLALQHGRGLLTIAFITVALPLIASVVNTSYRVASLPGFVWMEVHRSLDFPQDRPLQQHHVHDHGRRPAQVQDRRDRDRQHAFGGRHHLLSTWRGSSIMRAGS